MAQGQGRPITGFWSTLTPEQKKLALEYDGNDVIGSNEELSKIYESNLELAYDFAYIAYRLIEGDDVIDEFFKLAIKFKFVDENGEWIYDDED